MGGLHLWLLLWRLSAASHVADYSWQIVRSGKIFPRKQHFGWPFFFCIQLCLPPPACGVIKVALLRLIVFSGHFCGGGRNILGDGTNFGRPQNTLVTFTGLLSFKCSTSKDLWSQQIITSNFNKNKTLSEHIRWGHCWSRVRPASLFIFELKLQPDSIFSQSWDVDGHIQQLSVCLSLWRAGPPS